MARPTGSKNKITLEVKKKLQSIIAKDYKKVEKELNSLTGKAYLEMYLKILEFIIPKAKEEVIESQSYEPPKIYIDEDKSQ